MRELCWQNAETTRWLGEIAKRVCAILGVLVFFWGMARAQTSPSITGFLVNGVASSTGPVGATLTIQGSGFGTTQGFSTATLNGIAVAGNGVKPTSWSDTSIVVVIPTTASSGPVIVKVSGRSSNAVNFAVGALISTISATTAPVGSSITITGAGFGTSGGTVTFGGAAANTSSWTAGSIVAQVPNAATAGPIIVTVGNQASNGLAFTPTPVITGVSPGSGVSDTTVTITGTGFGSIKGPGIVTFNSLAATVSNWSPNSITVLVPANGTGGANNVVVTMNGISSSPVGFTVIPQMTNISPGSGVAGSLVTISGSNFGAAQGASSVTFSGTPAPPATNWSTNSITVAVPLQATSGNVAVTVGGQQSSGIPFTLIPQISGITPVSGPAGTLVTIAGSGFGTSLGSSSVTFSGTTASPTTTWSVNSITVPVPSAATTGNVVVTVGKLPSNGVPFIVNAVVALSSSATTSTYGSSVTFTATVTPSNATGTVTFNDGGTSLGTATISAGSASLTTSALAAGSHSITATYSGDNNYGTAQSAALTQTVNQASVTLSLAVSPGGTPSFGTTMTFTTTVTPSNVTGNVTFADGSTTLGTAPINNGQAVFTISTLDTGAHSITASFPGSSNFVSATSAAVSAPVGSAPVKVDICCAGTSVYGNSASFNATITPLTVNPRQKVPTGTVFFQDNDISHLLCEAAVSAGPATGTANCTTSALTGGNHNILANYLDSTNTYRDPNNSPPSIVWTVTPAASSVTLASDSPNNTSHTGQRVTFTATVTGVQGGATPTGTVVFNDTFNGTTTQLGSGPVGTNRQATFSTFFSGTASAGQHSITAVYNQDNADKNYQSSTSNAVPQTVNVIPTITSMTPTNGPAGMGFSLTGTSFGNNAGTVTINGAQATVLQWSDTKITLQVPGTAAGAYPPVITTSDNKASDPKSTQNFTVRARIVPCSP